VNLDLGDSQDVVVSFEGAASGSAERWLLNGRALSDNNELALDQPQVTIMQDQIDHFGNGYRLTLAPHSMTALRWQMR